MILLYLDPGSGSFLIQLVVAALAGAGIAIGANWKKLKRFLGRLKGRPEPENEEEDDNTTPGA
jgi:hypothetical protein